MPKQETQYFARITPNVVAYISNNSLKWDGIYVVFSTKCQVLFGAFSLLLCYKVFVILGDEVSHSNSVEDVYVFIHVGEMSRVAWPYIHPKVSVKNSDILPAQKVRQ